MTITEQALALCKETEAESALCASLSKRLEELGFAHTWAFPNGDETIWTHPSVQAHNDGCTGAAILSSYFCDLRRTRDELWFSVGRIGNSVNFRRALPPEEHKTCPQCGGEVFHGYLRWETRMVLKPGNKRRTRQQVEIKGWRCVGHYTDPVTRECGWTEEK